MPTALVIAFDARDNLFGQLTAQRRGLVIRCWDSDEMRKTARYFLEVRGGTPDLATEMGKYIDVTLEAESSGPQHWRGWMQFNDPTQVAEVPLVRAVRNVREASPKSVVQYQGGGATLRVDLREPPADRLRFLADLRVLLVKNGITASTWLDDVSVPLEQWDPPVPILP